VITPRLFIGLASALVLSGCNAALQCGSKATDTAKFRNEVVLAAHARIAALNAHDAEKNVGADMPDVVVMFHGAPNGVGVPADLATTKAMIADPAAHVDLSGESVDVGGPDFAVYHSAYDLTLTNAETRAPAHEHGNLLIGFQRQASGALKVAWEVASDTPSPK
jgi:ketosteroid isomerase-like protein